MKAWLLRAWIAIGLALFAYVLTRTPLFEIRDAIAAMGPAVSLSPVLAALWFATRTSALAAVLEHRAPWKSLYALRWIGDGYNGVLPLAGVGGEPMKLRILDRFVPVEDGLAALVRDRLIDNGLGFIVSGACVAIGLVALAAPPLSASFTLYAAIAVPLGAVMLALMITRLPGRLGALVARTFGDSDREPEPLPRAAFWRALAWFALTRALQAGETTLLLACIGAPIDLPTVLFVDGALNAAGFAGFLMPQGLGVVEGVVLVVLTGLGLPPATAVAFGLVRRGRVVFCGLVAIAVHVGNTIASRRAR